ncbi:hypothetical protein LXL04_019116 [Taraxacum kok-saghyz]
MLYFNEESRSPFVKKFKTIIHPGEVNRIRELPQNNKIVATHIDSPDVHIWDVEAQPNRHAILGATESRPDLILTGHQEKAEVALAMCQSEPFVLSRESPGSNGPKTEDNVTDSPKIQARGSIKAIQILAQEFCSVGDDTVLFYGMREPDLLQLLMLVNVLVQPRNLHPVYYSVTLDIGKRHDLHTQQESHNKNLGCNISLIRCGDYMISFCSQFS